MNVAGTHLVLQVNGDSSNPSKKSICAYKWIFSFVIDEYRILSTMPARAITGTGIALLGLLIALLQFLATRYFLYWEFWWYDIMMHFLGGLFIGASFLWFVYFEASRLKKNLPVFVATFAVVFTVGVSWELFEYVTGMYNAVNYTLDTTLDLAMDIAGMMGAYLFFKRV